MHIEYTGCLVNMVKLYMAMKAVKAVAQMLLYYDFLTSCTGTDLGNFTGGSSFRSACEARRIFFGTPWHSLE